MQSNHFFPTSLLVGILSLAGARTALGDAVVTVAGASGGQSIPADTAHGAWTTLNGPSITNAQSAALSGAGTLVLTVPSGFELNPNATVTALVSAMNGNNPTIFMVPVAVTSSNLTLVVASRTTGNAGSHNLTFQGIQVRPISGAPLASGYITQSGTGSFQNINHLTGNWGFLREVGGTVVGYLITGTNQTTAGSPISITIQKVDQYGNPVSDSTSENLIFTGFGTIGTNAPTVNGSTSAFTTGISVTFDTNGTAVVTVVDYLAETGTLNVTDGTGTGGSGLTISVAPGTASALNFTTTTATVTYGSSFGVSVQTTDAYGNLSKTGLGSTVPVTLNAIGGPGGVVGAVTQDIGAAAGNGSISFTGLQITAAGSTTISADAVGFTSGTLLVNVAPLVVTPNVAIGDKVYDGTTAASIISGTLSGVLTGDVVSLDSNASAHFVNKHVGQGKPVIVSGLSLTGPAAANYQLSTTSLTSAADITPRQLVIASVPENRRYDGTVHSGGIPAIVTGQIAVGDQYSLTQKYSDKSAGHSKRLIPSATINDGNGGMNYSVTLVETNGDIVPQPLTVTGVADTKIYDGSTTSGGTPAIEGTVINGDLPLFTQVFESKAAGSGKSVIPSGTIVDGNGGANYNITFVSAPLGTIQPRSLHITGIAADKVFDGTASASVTLSDDRLPGDNVQVHFSGALFVDGNVGVSKTVQISGITLAGPDAGSYTPNSTATAMANITSVTSTAALVSSQNPSLEGSSIDLTVSVNGVNSGAATPSGKVQFYANNQPLGDQVVLSSGIGTLTTAMLPAGSNSVSAIYLGDGNFQGSSASIMQVVQMVITNYGVLKIVDNGDGTATVTGQGNPNSSYIVQATFDLAAPIQWENFSTNTAGFIDGKWSFVDDMTKHEKRFFRAVQYEIQN